MAAAHAESFDPLVTRWSTPTVGTIASEIEVKEAGERDSWRFVISHENVDLMGDVVVQAGLTPVGPRIPAQVDHSGQMRDLIGWWDNITTEAKRTLATLHLIREGITWSADLVRSLLNEKVRMAASIGFVPDENAYELIRDEKNEWVTGFKFLKATLIETSIVVVPAQPLALNVLKSLSERSRRAINQAKLDSFVVTPASQQLLRRMPASDAIARATAVAQKALALTKGG